MYWRSQLIERDVTHLLLETLLSGFLSKPKRLMFIYSEAGIKAISLLSKKSGHAQTIEKITLLDPQRHHVQNTQMTLEINEVPEDQRKKIEIVPGEPKTQLIKMSNDPQRQLYDFIDVDSKGSSIDILSSVWPLFEPEGEGNVLALSFTDMRILCGVDHNKQANVYHSITRNSPAPHESAIRVAMLAVEKNALKNGFKVKPLLSFHGDFMNKLYFHVTKIQKAEPLPEKSEHFLLSCPECEFMRIKDELSAVSRCGVCETPLLRLGPVWGKMLFNVVFVQEMLKKLEGKSAAKYITNQRIKEMLVMMLDEAKLGNQAVSPVRTNYLSAFFKCVPPSLLWIKYFYPFGFMTFASE